MGYDCTLHLVDERAIRDIFVPRLLGESDEETALDRVMENSEELWEQGRAALEGEDGEEAAKIVCQLAVVFSACMLPHQYERGLALCLWGEQDASVAVDFPGEFVFSPERMFERVVKRYPELAGHFPEWFDGNDSTGIFIPAARVAEVLAWVEAKVRGFEKGEQRRFKGLLGILRAAATKGLAYWEATDLAVPMAGEFPGDPTLMTAGFLGNEAVTEGTGVETAAYGAHVASLGKGIVDGWLVSADYKPWETTFWDLSVWPPRLAGTLPEFASEWGRSRDGRWILFSATDRETNPRVFRPRIFDGAAGSLIGEFPLLVDGREPDIDGGGFVGRRAVAFLRPPSNAKPGDLLAPPWWLDGGEWKPMPGLQPAVARPSYFSVERPVVGIVELGNGSVVVVWNGDGYEWTGERFEKTFPMGAHGAESQWTYARGGDDGFFYLANRCLFEVHRGGEPRAHAAKWTNIMFVMAGPAGSILLQEGDNKHGDVGKLYFPADETFIHIEPELFDDGEYSRIFWGADRFVVLGGKFLAVPTERVMGLQRHNARTGRAVKR